MTMPSDMKGYSSAKAVHLAPVQLPEWVAPGVLGLFAGAAAALFVAFHWTAAVVAALVAALLSAVENEVFLLVVIFLLSVSWVRPDGAVRDLMVPLRIIVLLGFFAGRIWRGQVNFHRLWAPGLSRLFLLFLFVAALSVTLGSFGWKHDLLAQTYRLVSAVGFYCLALVWVDSPQRLRRVLMVLLGSVCLLGLFSGVQVAAGGYTKLWFYFNPPGPEFIPWSGRASGLLPYPNVLSGYLDLTLPFAIASWHFGRGWLKRLGGWALILGVAALGFSQSLGGIICLGFVLALAVLFFVSSTRRKLLYLSMLMLSAICFYLIRHLLNPSHFASASITLGPDVLGRLLEFQVAWSLFLQHPFLGVGFGGFALASGGMLPKVYWLPAVGVTSSSLYLNLLAETGVLGCAVFLYLMYLAGRMAWRELRAAGGGLRMVVGFGAFGAVSSVFVHGLVDYIGAAQYLTLLCLLLGLLVAASEMHSKGDFSSGAARRKSGSEMECE